MPDGGYTARVDSLLLELASQEATGCLTVTEPQGEQATVWFRDGQVYAVSVPGRRPLLGVRLMSSGVLTPESLAEALEVQRTELQGWRLGELLVHLKFVDRAVVESFVSEQVRDQVADLLHWDVADKKFRNGKRTRQDVAPSMEVTDLLGSARQRDEQWAAIVPFIGGPDAVPVLSTAAPAASDVVLGPYDWALLCKVDGQRTIADLADDCGFTVHEAGLVVVGLLQAGLVEIDGGEAEEPAAPWWSEGTPTDADVAESVARVTAALTDMGMPQTTSPFAPAPRRQAPAAAVASLAEPVEEPAYAEAEEQAAPSPFTLAPVPQLAEVVDLDAERMAREEQERIAALEAQLLQAEREEAQRVAAQREEAARLEAERLEQERLAAEQLAIEVAEAEVAAYAEAERLAAEEAARAAEEAARLAAEEAARLEQERLEAEEAARAEAERLAAEIADAEEQAYAEAEQRATDEAARIEAERLAAEIAEAEVAAYTEAEQRAADEAARAEAERLAAEIADAEEEAYAEAEQRAAVELARLEAERAEARAAEEAVRAEAERLAAEEAARAEAERLAAEEAARAEAERLAAEDAARAEAERLAAEDAARAEAERLAAEEAERLEQERLAAEEAARVEAERLEQERIEAEEAARAAAQEFARMEAERVAAEAAAEAERAAAEQAEVERLAAAEAERVALAEPQPWDAPAAFVPQEAPVEVGATAFADIYAALDQASTVEDGEVEELPEPVPAASVPAAAAYPDYSGGFVATGAPGGAQPVVMQPQANDGADTAALLRELSSLGGGFDDAGGRPSMPGLTNATPVSGAGAGAVTRPLQPAEKPKKKKGIFGR